MYTTRPWTIRQYAGFSTAQESNAFYRNALRDGADGISVAFDLPTHRGYDLGQSPRRRRRRDGRRRDRLRGGHEDPVRRHTARQDSVSMTMSGAVLPIMACFIVAAEEQGVAESSLTGTIRTTF